MVNRVILQGRLTRDPEIKEVGGFSLAEFTVAWSEKYKDIEKKCFMPCKAWRSTADFVGKYFKKGQELVVEGQIITETWEKDGQNYSRLLCNTEKVDFCGSKSSGTGDSPAPASAPNDGFLNIPEGTDEEIPWQ